LPGHVFDANTLRNFVLIGKANLLPLVCEGTLTWSGIVKDELAKGPKAFKRQFERELLMGDTQRHDHLLAFEKLETTLTDLEFINTRLNTSTAQAEMFLFFVCLVESERMDEGEAESLAFAAYRDRIFYTDDLHAYKAVERYNSGQSRCPPYGANPPPYARVKVHSSAWLLIEAVNQQHLTMKQAEAIFNNMVSVWGRHPRKTLTDLQKKGLFW
jgi:hypothetical protein